MMLITAFLNTLSPGTITGGLTVALATRHRMQYMQKVRHKSRTFGVHYLDLRPDVLRPGDEIIITEVDRLGRNKQEILRELQYYRDYGVRVKVLELPTTLIDLSAMDNVMARPTVITVKEFAKEYANVENGNIRPFELMKQLGMSKATFYRYVNKIRKD